MLEKIINQINTTPPTYLRVKVIPKSQKTEIVEILDDETIKIRLNAAPEKGKANIELIAYLSKTFKIPKKNIILISGHTSHLKLIKII